MDIQPLIDAGFTRDDWNELNRRIGKAFERGTKGVITADILNTPEKSKAFYSLIGDFKTEQA